jgi:hypothetical protein
VWAEIPASAELVGELERDLSYHPQAEFGFEFYFKQGPRRYKFVGRDDIPGVAVFVEGEPEPPEIPGPGSVAASAFRGEVHWVPPGHRHPAPPPITRRDWLYGKDVIDLPATQARDARLYDRRRDAERAEAQASKKALEDDLQRVQQAGAEQLPALITELTSKAHDDPRYTRLVEIASQTLQDLTHPAPELTPEEVKAKQETSDAADARMAEVLRLAAGDDARTAAEASAAPPAPPAPSDTVAEAEAEKYADDHASKGDIGA